MLRLQNGEMSFEGLSVAKVLGSAAAQQMDFLQELDCELGAAGWIGDAKRDHQQQQKQQTHTHTYKQTHIHTHTSTISASTSVAIVMHLSKDDQMWGDMQTETTYSNDLASVIEPGKISDCDLTSKSTGHYLSCCKL